MRRCSCVLNSAVARLFPEPTRGRIPANATSQLGGRGDEAAPGLMPSAKMLERQALRPIPMRRSSEHKLCPLRQDARTFLLQLSSLLQIDKLPKLHISSSLIRFAIRSPQGLARCRPNSPGATKASVARALLCSVCRSADRRRAFCSSGFEASARLYCWTECVPTPKRPEFTPSASKPRRIARCQRCLRRNSVNHCYACRTLKTPRPWRPGRCAASPDLPRR